MKLRTISLFLIMISGGLSAQTAETFYQPLKYRNIGPFRGGRSVTATGVVNDPFTYYMGTTGGGLWKTSNAGVLWENISDGFFEMGSVGAVAVSHSNPNVVYCGMGEHAVRGVMSSYGDGMYKSTDGGKTWKKSGLEKTQHIARILIHPTNPDIVFVAAQGALYGPTKERGIYKSTDGGETWKQVLYVNDLTGCNELSMVWSDPDVIYASMWHHQRRPDMVISGGEGSGLYKSTDGGESWEKIHNGLPEEKGKMAIAVSQANPEKVYAVIESDTEKDLGGLFVSEDAGASWKMVSGDNRLVQRAWYYIEVFPDPNNEQVVYVMSAQALRSIDGGKTWEEIHGKHGDYHDLWINPSNSDNMIIADDGGAAISFDYGETWSSLDIMPTAQFYRINTDRQFPYNIYGGQQDNTSVKIAHLSLSRDGIGQQDWSYSAGGESAFLAFDPDNPRYVMGGSYLGYIDLLDTQTKASTKVLAAPIQYLGRAARDMKYLYNWNAPIIRSAHEPNTFFHCAQLVLRTRDMGKSWEEISPDLTRNMDEKQGKGGGPYTVEAVGAENYGTISYMIESPHEKGVYWTGSDDGLVYLTRNGGQEWENVTPKGLKECLINAIEVSPHDPATAYIATTRYKFNDYTPALYKTENYGKTWTNISAGIPYGSFTRVVREDMSREGLLYAGTEKGVYISWNDGNSWEPLQLNLPKAPITDLKVHQGDLIVATSGRSFWILDDLAALAQYNPGRSEFRVFPPEDALNASWGSPLNGNKKDFKGTHPYEGVNPANGMVIYYEVPEIDDAKPLVMEIRNDKGKLIRSFSSIKDSTYQEHNGGGPPPKPVLTREKGLNRFVWDLNYPIMEGIPGAYMEAGFEGHKAPPGTYEISLTMGENKASTSGTIIATPGFDVSPAQYAEYDVFMSEMEAELSAMHIMVNQLYRAQAQLRNLLQKMEEGELKDSGSELLRRMVSWDEDMIQRKSQAYDDVENFPNKFTAEYIYLINASNSEIPRINQGSMERKKELDAQWAVLKSRAQEIMETAIPDYNKALWESGIGAIQLN